jgi:hypothetical protein
MQMRRGSGDAFGVDKPGTSTAEGPISLLLVAPWSISARECRLVYRTELPSLLDEEKIGNMASSMSIKIHPLPWVDLEIRSLQSEDRYFLSSLTTSASSLSTWSTSQQNASLRSAFRPPGSRPRSSPNCTGRSPWRKVFTRMLAGRIQISIPFHQRSALGVL